MWQPVELVSFVIKENKANRDLKNRFVVVGLDKFDSSHIWIPEDGRWVFNTYDEPMFCRLFVKNPTMEILVKTLEELE